MTESKPPSQDAAEKRRELMRRWLREGAPSQASLVASRASPGEAPARASLASLAQRRFWEKERRYRAAVGNQWYVARLDGALQLEAFRTALRAIYTRHQILRSCFRLRGEELALVVTDAAAPELPYFDLSDRGAALALAEARARIERQVRLKFDLGQPSLFRVELYRISTDVHVLMLLVHHSIFDGWSMGIFISELNALYNGVSELAAPPLQYSDFAQWEREWLTTPAASASLNHWLQHLAGAEHAARLPHAGSEVHVDPEDDYCDRSYTHTFSVATSDAIRTCSRRQKATVAATLLAGLDVWIHGASGGEDVLVLTGTANRKQERWFPVFGPFVSVVALRNRVRPGQAFSELLVAVSAELALAQSHGSVPLGNVLDTLAAQGKSLQFDIGYVMQNVPLPELRLGSARTSPLDVHFGSGVVGLVFYLMESKVLAGATDSFVLCLQYNSKRFDERRVLEICAEYEGILARACADADAAVSQLVAEKKD